MNASSDQTCQQFEQYVLPTLYGIPTNDYKNLCIALLILTSVYFIFGIYLYLKYRMKLLRLQSRSMFMTFTLALSLMLLNVYLYIREYVGRQYMPCQSVVWIPYLSLSLSAGAYVGNLYTYIYKLRIQRDQGIQLILHQKHMRKNEDLTSRKEKPIKEKKEEKKYSTLFYIWEYLSVLKFSKHGKIFVQGYEEKDDDVGSTNQSDSVTGGSLFIFSHDSTSEDFTYTIWDKIKDEFIYPLLVLILFGTGVMVCAIVRISLDPIMAHNCRGCTQTFVDYIILGSCVGVIGIVMVIGIYCIRNEADPLGIKPEGKIGALCGLFCLPFCIIQIVDPGHYNMGYKFTWDIAISFISLVIYYPVIYGHIAQSYFERRTRRRLETSSLGIYNDRKTSTAPIDNPNGSPNKMLPPLSRLDVNLIIQDPRARNALLEHTVNELSSENLVFVFKVKSWKAIWDKEQPIKVNKIAISLYNEYISRNSKNQINISNEVMENIEKQITPYFDQPTPSIRPKSKNITPITSRKVPMHIFDECEQECINIIKTDTLPRFRNSPLFKERIVDSGILGNVMIT